MISACPDNNVVVVTFEILSQLLSQQRLSIAKMWGSKSKKWAGRACRIEDLGPPSRDRIRVLTVGEFSAFHGSHSVPAEEI